MNPQEIIDPFFIRDGQAQPNGAVRKSVLLALERDFGFCILLPGIWMGQRSTIRVSDEQYAALQTKLPIFTIISLFCTAVDVLARVVNKNAIPPRGQNSRYFTGCAETCFHLTDQEARALWRLRNGVSHGYHLLQGYAARQYGHGRIMLQRPDRTWELYLHAMYTLLQQVKREVYNQLSAETPAEKQETATYLESNGFFYTRS